MGIEVYNQQNAISDDPYVLVLKLYEGVIKYLVHMEHLAISQYLILE